MLHHDVSWKVSLSSVPSQITLHLLIAIHCRHLQSYVEDIRFLPRCVFLVQYLRSDVTSNIPYFLRIITVERAIKLRNLHINYDFQITKYYIFFVFICNKYDIIFMRYGRNKMITSIILKSMFIPWDIFKLYSQEIGWSWLFN